MTMVEDLLTLGRQSGRRTAQAQCTGNAQLSYVALAQALLRVRDRTGQTVPLRANPAQLAFERRRGAHNIVLKARQMGITTWIAGRFFLKTITRSGVLTVQVAHTREAAEAIFTIVQRMWENLPAPLREGPLKRSRANLGQMVFPHLDSEFRVVSAADANAGRGLTIQNLHCSELGRWPNDPAATLAGLRAALAPGGESCLESTPQGAYGCFYEEWLQAAEVHSNEQESPSGTQQKNVSIAPDTALTRHFLPWWLEPAYVASPVDDLNGEETRLVQLHGLSREQIGFRRGLESSFRGLREQEFAEDAVTCFKASGQCCFDAEKIEVRRNNLPAPIETRRGGALQIWLPPVNGREYLVAVDSAGGGADGDYAAIQVIELTSGLQCAELRERIGTLETARMAARLGREYRGATGPALIAVERNNHGSGVLAYLDSTEAYARVYEQDGVAGFLTSAGSKPRIVSRLGALLEDRAELMMSARLLAECRTFITGANGSTGAAPGTHDDCVMAMAIAHDVRAELLGRKP